MVSKHKAKLLGETKLGCKLDSLSIWNEHSSVPSKEITITLVELQNPPLRLTALALLCRSGSLGSYFVLHKECCCNCCVIPRKEA